MNTHVLDPQDRDATDPPETISTPACWSAVLAMSLCVFSLIASEFMPMSLLTPIAADLRISEGLAGYGIAISGAFAVVTSLSISTLARSMDRKTVLLLLTGMMCLSGLIVATAQSYLVYMIGRALIGVVIGGFWSLSAAVAMRLVPPASVPRALAIFNGGNALATVVAAPLGSYLGGTIGWRGAFFCLVPVALIALAGQWISLPAMKTEAQETDSGNAFRLFRRPIVTYGLLAVGTFFIGQFVLFTYVRPFLEHVVHASVSTLSLILLAIGVAGLIGTSLIGSVLKLGLYRTLIIIPLLMAAIAFALTFFGGTLWVSFLLLGLWGFFATAAPVGWWAWLTKSLPHDAEAGGGLMVAVIQFSIAIGSGIGGVLFDGGGYRATFATSGVLLLLAGFLAFTTSHKHAAGHEKI